MQTPLVLKMQSSFPELMKTIVPMTNTELLNNRKQILRQMIQQFNDSNGAEPKVPPFDDIKMEPYFHLREKFVPFMITSLCDHMRRRILLKHTGVTFSMKSMFCAHQDLWMVDATEKEIHAYNQVVETNNHGNKAINNEHVLSLLAYEIEDELPHFLPGVTTKIEFGGDSSNGYTAKFKITL